MNKHLFQNGRVLLKCRSFILLQLVIPTLKSHAATRHVTTRTCHCEQTFQDGPHIFCPCCLLRSGFRACCVVVEFHSSHSFTISPRIAPHFRIVFAKIRQVLTSFRSSFALFRACCVVVRVSLQQQFRHFAAYYSSFSYYFYENLTGFGVFYSIVRFVLFLLCCC
jgi:hypothetical protein